MHPSKRTRATQRSSCLQWVMTCSAKRFHDISQKKSRKIAGTFFLSFRAAKRTRPMSKCRHSLPEATNHSHDHTELLDVENAYSSSSRMKNRRGYSTISSAMLLGIKPATAAGGSSRRVSTSLGNPASRFSIHRGSRFPSCRWIASLPLEWSPTHTLIAFFWPGATTLVKHC